MRSLCYNECEVAFVFARIIFLLIFIFSVTANAEVRTYEGVDEDVMTNFERSESAKKRVQDYAKRNVQEQFGIFIKSYSQSKNSNIEHDEIIAISVDIMKIIDS